MNDKLKTIINVLPIVLIPLIFGRQKIKEHPEVEKLNQVSKTAYTSVKNKSIDTAHTISDTAGTIKDKSVSAYETGKHTYEAVSDKISDTKQNIEHKRELKKERKKEQEAQETLKETEVPNMMKSSDTGDQKALVNHTPDNQALHFKAPGENGEPLDLTSESLNDKLKNGDDNTDRTKENNMKTYNVEDEYFKRVKNHEDHIETFNNSHLFLNHHYSFKPASDAHDKDSAPNPENSALFEQHRRQAENHIESIGRKRPTNNHMKRSKK